jgi:hypothetical protein
MCIYLSKNGFKDTIIVFLFQAESAWAFELVAKHHLLLKVWITRFKRERDVVEILIFSYSRCGNFTHQIVTNVLLMTERKRKGLKTMKQSQKLKLCLFV